MHPGEVQFLDAALSAMPESVKAWLAKKRVEGTAVAGVAQKAGPVIWTPNTDLVKA